MIWDQDVERYVRALLWLTNFYIAHPILTLTIATIIDAATIGLGLFISVRYWMKRNREAE